MELSKSHNVLKATLVEVGLPADSKQPSAWPTEKRRGVVAECREDCPAQGR